MPKPRLGWWAGSMILLLLTGCGVQAPSPTPGPSVPASSPASAHGAAQGEAVAQTPPVPQRAAETPSCEKLSEHAAIDLLVGIVKGSPEERVTFTTGKARSIFVEEAASVKKGWPIAHLNGWRQTLWSAVTLEPSGTDKVVVRITHGKTRAVTRFVMLCEGGWKIAEIGTADATFEPRAAALPGQSQAGMPLETSLMELGLGMPVAEAESLRPEQDDPLELPYLWTARRVTYNLNEDGRIAWIGAWSGATPRGLQVGDPADHVRQLYGPPTETRSDRLIYRNDQVQLEFVTAPDANGVPAVTKITLESLENPPVWSGA